MDSSSYTPFKGGPQSGNTYIRITSTKSPSFCMTTLSARLTNLTTGQNKPCTVHHARILQAPYLHQSHDYSCYVSRPKVAATPLWLQKQASLRAHDFAHSPGFWHHPRIARVTFAWGSKLCGINPAINNLVSDTRVSTL